MTTDPLIAAARLFQAGRLDEAAKLCERLLAARPTHPGALSLAGLVALRRGDVAGALRRLTLAASVDSRNAMHQFNLAEALSAAGRILEAVETYRRALKLDPRRAIIHNGLGFALRALGDHAGALDAFSRAASLDRNAADIHINLGTALHLAGRNDEAAAALRRAVSLAPNAAEAHFNLGVVLAAAQDIGGAVQAYDAALSAAPNHVGALNNLGLLHEQRGDATNALRFYDRVTAIAPEFAEAWHNRGNALKNLGRFSEAVGAYDRALALKPDYRDARRNRAHVQLTLGRFAAGWNDYLSRELLRPPDAYPTAPLPSDLRGERILVEREQGVGDELFFLRFAPRLRARGAEVVATVDPRLEDMIGRSGAVTTVLRPGDDPGRIDRRVALADLPFLLEHTSAADCPPAIRIPPASSALETMRARLDAAGPAPYIAVTWRAGTASNVRRIAPELLGRALSGTRGTVIVVQRNPTPDEMTTFAAALGRAAADLTEINADLESMLALMSLVGTYVAVSNANVHLRECAGCPTHALIPHPPEWRWLTDTRVSPWFPDAILYRQAANGDWTEALDQLARDLSH